jgi:hypothetical protein
MQHRPRRTLAALLAALLLVGVTQILPPGLADAQEPAVPTCAVIDNGVVRLGVLPQGHLNCGVAEIEGGFTYGLTYLPSGPTADSLSPGCDCEAWGVGVKGGTIFGQASQSNNPIENVEVVSFDTTATTAVSVVDVPNSTEPTFRVTHDFRPASVPELYQVRTSIQNVSAAPVTPLYRRTMDWDIPPTEFDEFVTIQGTATSEFITYASDDGFQPGNPLLPPTFIDFEGDAVDNGPNDHGANFDFEFPTLAAGETRTFTQFYGAAGTQASADAVLATVGAEAYSYGQPNTPDGPTLGTPNTFIWAFQGVGGVVQFPTVQFSSAEYSVVEDEGPAEITVTLNSPTDDDVTVEYATSDGTAVAPDDYEATSGTLTIPAGSTSATFEVPIVDDGIEEGPETVNLTLSDPTVALPGEPFTAVLTITDPGVEPTPTPPASPSPPPAAPTATPVARPPTFTG